MWVLVVEDEPDLLELDQAILEDEGFTVAAATHGRRALRLLDEVAPRRPAAIVTDMMMPEMDGLALLRELASRSGAPPVIAVSGVTGYLHEARRLGAVAALQKPFSCGELVEAVRRAAAAAPAAPAPAGPSPEDERRRLEAIVALGLDRDAPAQGLDDFVNAVARAFDVPMCFVSLITEARQLWLAGCGVPADLASERGGARAESFCTHAVAARSALVVQDAADNPYFKDNPFVTRRGVRFYAGVPLIGRAGHALGTLCLLDVRPREFSHFDVELLGLLARRVLAAFELRARSGEPASVLEHTGYLDPASGLLGREGLLDLLGAEMWRHARHDLPLAVVVVDTGDARWPEVGRRLVDALRHAWVARIGPTRVGAIVPGQTAQEARAAVAPLVGAGARLQAAAAVGPGSLARGVLAAAEGALGVA